MSADGDGPGGREPRLFRRRVFPRRRRLRRALVAGLAALVVLFGAVTARVFIWPATGMPAHVDAIVVLGGPQAQQRLALGLRLGAAGRARYVLVSEGVTDPVPGLCQPHATFTVICWNPVPGTTQGEAEFVGQITRQRGWSSVVLVTTPDQVWRPAAGEPLLPGPGLLDDDPAAAVSVALPAGVPVGVGLPRRGAAARMLTALRAAAVYAPDARR